MFESTTGKLCAAGWFPKTGDAELNLNFVKSHYSYSQFQKRPVEQTKSDFISDEVYLSDAKTGLEILYSPFRDEVESIGRISAKPASRVSASTPTH